MHRTSIFALLSLFTLSFVICHLSFAAGPTSRPSPKPPATAKPGPAGNPNAHPWAVYFELARKEQQAKGAAMLEQIAAMQVRAKKLREAGDSQGGQTVERMIAKLQKDYAAHMAATPPPTALTEYPKISNMSIDVPTWIDSFKRIDASKFQPIVSGKPVGSHVSPPPDALLPGAKTKGVWLIKDLNYDSYAIMPLDIEKWNTPYKAWLKAKYPDGDPATRPATMPATAPASK